MSKGILRSASRRSNMWSKLSNIVTIFYCSFLADEIQSVDSHFVHDGFFSSVPQCKYHLIILDNFLLVYLFVLCVYVSAAYIFDSDAFLHIFLSVIIFKDIGHIKYEVRTVHHTELIFVMPKNLSVPLQDIFAERENTYLLMYAHW